MGWRLRALANRLNGWPLVDATRNEAKVPVRTGGRLGVPMALGLLGALATTGLAFMSYTARGSHTPEVEHYAAPGRATFARGDVFSIPVDRRDNTFTLVLMIRPACGHCLESVSFHRRLINEARRQGRVQVIGAGYRPFDTVQEYFTRHGLRTDHNVVLSHMTRVAATPTLVLLDPTGVILDVWSGTLTPEEEEHVWASVISLFAE
jgi:hypothetical protein